jgi:hypothetical protein
LRRQAMLVTFAASACASSCVGGARLPQIIAHDT